MRILITGGLGFLGGRLAAYLYAAGHQIVLGSRRIAEPPFWLPKAEVAKINWGENESIQSCCKSIDVVIHTAGMNAKNCILNPVDALAINGLNTARLVSAANEAGVKQFIYLSTAHVYANPLVGVLTEEICPTNLHPYATTHLAGEQAVLGASKLGEMHGIVLRISNAFGAPMDQDVNCWMLLVNDLCRQAVQTRKLKLQTNGLQERNFINIHSLCKIVESIVISPTREVDIKTDIYNVGSGVSQTVLAMARLVQQRCFEILGCKIFVELAEEISNDRNLKLDFRVNKLSELGIQSNELENIAEIDQLINFCQSHFEQGKKCLK